MISSSASWNIIGDRPTVAITAAAAGNHTPGLLLLQLLHSVAISTLLLSKVLSNRKIAVLGGNKFVDTTEILRA